MKIFIITVWLVLQGCSDVQQTQVLEEYSSGRPKVLRILVNERPTLQKAYYANGVKKSEWQVDSLGVANGDHKEWDPKGDLKVTGQNKAGAKTGTWKYWLGKRLLLEQGEFVNNQKHGLWQEFYHDGSIRIHKEFKMGDTTGQWVEYYKSGDTAKVNSCFASNDVGWDISYSIKGIQTKKTQCKKGIPHGVHKKYDDLGRVLETGYYRDGIMDSTWTWYYVNGQPKQVANYNLGKREGQQLFYNRQGHTYATANLENGSGVINIPCSGRLAGKICAETTYVEGQISGNLVAYIPSSRLWVQETWSQGQKLSEQAVRNDQMVRSGSYSNGKKHGLWKIFWPNGKPKQILRYHLDSLRGWQEYFDTTGVLTSRTLYQGPHKEVIFERSE
jgi:uncharacterized protein